MSLLLHKRPNLYRTEAISTKPTLFLLNPTSIAKISMDSRQPPEPPTSPLAAVAKPQSLLPLARSPSSSKPYLADRTPPDPATSSSHRTKASK
ncbi:hypothetical protein IEQ34_007478 [Dendrobium chrysotoxum]|uniref:Uncharacterized protein n=1 Tax=Dendrobium chrysotoxum TaxID=161865 RepID=A0AAV7H1K2_DENCH|nr:hypothetical protein IEQ34_007478 [Dendrobium chrysotoxum]